MKKLLIITYYFGTIAERASTFSVFTTDTNSEFINPGYNASKVDLRPCCYIVTRDRFVGAPKSYAANVNIPVNKGMQALVPMG